MRHLAALEEELGRGLGGLSSQEGRGQVLGHPLLSSLPHVSLLSSISLTPLPHWPSSSSAILFFTVPHPSLNALTSPRLICISLLLTILSTRDSPHRLPHITFFAPSCLFNSVLTLSPPTPEITPPPELDVPPERGSMMNGLHWLHHGPWSMLC